MKQISPSLKNRIVLLGVILLAALASNWVYTYAEIAREDSRKVYRDPMVSTMEFSGGAAGEAEGDFRLGGWPLHYYYTRETFNGTTLSAFSWGSLLLNLLFWSGMVVLWFGYESVMRAKAKSNEDVTPPAKGKSRSLSLSDILLATAIVAALLVYGRGIYSTAAKHEEFAKSIVNAGGSVSRVAYAPSFLKERLPSTLQQMLLRVARAELVQPQSEQVAEVIGFGTVEELLLAGGSYDLRLLDDLRSQSALRCVRIAGRVVDAELLAAVGAAKQLEGISFIYTNVTEDGMKSLGEMPCLFGVDLANTDVFLSKDQMPAWGKSVLRLSLPCNREERQHVVKDWPTLIQLNVQDLNSTWSSSEMKVELDNLPKLRLLGLDKSYMFALNAKSLPKLAVLLQVGTGSRGVSQSQRVPKYLRFSDVHLQSISSLPIFGADAGWIRSFTIEDCGGLEFKLSLVNDGFEESELPHGEAYGAHLPAERRQKWIDALAQSKGVVKANLSHVAMAELDFSALAKLDSLQSLILRDSGTSAAQLAAFKGNESLQEIDLSGCDVSGTDLEKLLARMPNLRECKVDQFSLGRLRLMQHENIEQLIGRRVSDYSSVDALHLEALPKLKDVVDVSMNCQYLHLVDVPSLRGVICFGTMPKRSRISGLRDLTIFSSGGKWVTSEMAEAVLQCQKLQKLTLAYTGLAAESLRALAELKDLEVLVLTGTKIDEELLGSLSGLEKLRVLRLDETGIPASLLHSNLRSLPQLVELGVDQLDAKFASTLPRMEQLTKLHVRNTNVSLALMQQICSIPQLQYLDLTGCDVTATAAEYFATRPPPTLVEISLRNAKVEGPYLLKLARTYRHLYWNVTNLDTEFAALDYIVTSCRLREENAPVFYGGSGAVVTQAGQLPTLGEVSPKNYEMSFEDRLKAAGILPAGGGN
ncbi:MAG: hypothetical protein AAF483_13355 [Planctomycetota bacterium]